LSTKSRGLKDEGHGECSCSGIWNKEEWGREGADKSVLLCEVPTTVLRGSNRVT